METVKHKDWGVGVITKREVCVNGKFIEVDEGGCYITAKFDNGKEIRLAIPKSFENGILEPLGDLKTEVENAAAEIEGKRAEQQAKYGISDGTRQIEESKTRSTKKGAKIALTGDLKKDYESYLSASGYEDNVVYQYSRAIDIVCKEENITWVELTKIIMSVIKKYDKGGEKEKIGNYQKKTVINAIKRFKEFIKINPPVDITTP